MITDPIGDTLIRIKNGYMAHKKSVTVNYSKNNEILTNLLYKLGFLAGVKLNKTDSLKKVINLELKYIKDRPSLTDIVRVSKPSRKIYVKRDQIPRILGGKGYVILSTPKGFMTGKEAKKASQGGEIICKFW